MDLNIYIASRSSRTTAPLQNQGGSTLLKDLEILAAPMSVLYC